MGESRVTGAGFGGGLYMIDCGFPLMLLAGMEKNGKKDSLIKRALFESKFEFFQIRVL